MEAHPAAVVRAWTDGLARGERGRELWHPDMEIVNARGWVVEVTYRGPDALDRWWNDVAEAFSAFEFVVDDLKPAGDGRVLTTQRVVGTFRISGIDVDMPWYSILTVRDGRIVRAVGYLSAREAREALAS